MKNNKHIVYLIATAIVLFVSGCAVDKTQIIESEVKPQWEVALLTNPRCSSPCWETIIPGTTRMADAENILGSLAEVSQIVPPDPEMPLKVRFLNWSFNGGGRGRIYPSEDSRIVDNINLDPIYGSIRLNEINKYFSDPSYLSIYKIGTGAGLEVNTSLVAIAFPEKGLVVHMWVQLQDKDPIKIRILESGLIQKITYIRIGYEEFQKYMILHISSSCDQTILRSIQPWIGFVDYKYIDWGNINSSCND